jgi:hypothetical protein
MLLVHQNKAMMAAPLAQQQTLITVQPMPVLKRETSEEGGSMSLAMFKRDLERWRSDHSQAGITVGAPARVWNAMITACTANARMRAVVDAFQQTYERESGRIPFVADEEDLHRLLAHMEEAARQGDTTTVSRYNAIVQLANESPCDLGNRIKSCVPALEVVNQKPTQVQLCQRFMQAMTGVSPEVKAKVKDYLMSAPEGHEGHRFEEAVQRAQRAWQYDQEQLQQATAAQRMLDSMDPAVIKRLQDAREKKAEEARPPKQQAQVAAARGAPQPQTSQQYQQSSAYPPKLWCGKHKSWGTHTTEQCMLANTGNGAPARRVFVAQQEEEEESPAKVHVAGGRLHLLTHARRGGGASQTQDVGARRSADRLCATYAGHQITSWRGTAHVSQFRLRQRVGDSHQQGHQFTPCGRPVERLGRKS